MRGDVCVCAGGLSCKIYASLLAGMLHSISHIHVWSRMHVYSRVWGEREAVLPWEFCLACCVIPAVQVLLCFVYCWHVADSARTAAASYALAPAREGSMAKQHKHMERSQQLRDHEI